MAYGFYKYVEPATDWVIILLTIAMLARYGKCLLILLKVKWTKEEACDVAIAAVLALLVIRSITGLTGILALNTTDSLGLLNAGRMLANILTLAVIVPIVFAVEQDYSKIAVPIFRISTVILISAVLITGVIYVWYN